MATIQSDRLKLILLTVECLYAMSIGDTEAAQASGGFIVPRNCSLLRKPRIDQRLKMIAKDPEQHPWMYRAIVRKNDNVMAGYISFHHKAPDPDLMEYSNYAVELGYAVDQNYRRMGYARESALAMMEWANESGVHAFCVSISPQNTPSLRMAESMGFTKISERKDEMDGLEYVYIGDIVDIRCRNEKRFRQ